MRQIAIVLAALSMVAGATAVDAKPCRDSHGKFIKCNPMKALPKKHCRDAKGHFKKC